MVNQPQTPKPPIKGGTGIEDQPSADPEISVALIPPNSRWAQVVREAAHAAGAEFARLDPSSLADSGERILVVDLADATGLGRTERLGPRTIAIGHQYDLECFDMVAPDQVRLRLKRSLRNLVEQTRLEAKVARERRTIETLNELGYALSAPTSQADLLDRVLAHTRHVLVADGGSIYLVEEDQLRFVCSQNDTLPYRPRRKVLPIDERSLPGVVASRHEPLVIEDVYTIPTDVPWRPDFTFDQETGYRTRSVLLVPMHDRERRVIGVILLVNRKRQAGVPLASFEQVGSFGDAEVELARSIASQAAVAIENHRLYANIRNLFDGFVEAAVSAIEARDPSTGGHSHRVAELTGRLAGAVDACTDGPFSRVHFSSEELKELHYASLLHDFGKVGVREQVLLKAEKLYDWELNQVENRVRLASMQVMLEGVQQGLSVGETGKRLGRLQRDLALVRRVNRPGRRPSHDEIRELEDIAREWRLPDLDEPLLGARDIQRLCIPAGSLDPEERREIEAHVTHTWHFLRVIPWTPDLKRVPDLAYAHHEKLDGSGYPRGLKGKQIPLGARLMTIADIFDAVTAGDRPYKPRMSLSKAVGILREEAERGHLEEEAVELFVGQKLWTGLIDLPDAIANPRRRPLEGQAQASGWVGPDRRRRHR